MEKDGFLFSRGPVWKQREVSLRSGLEPPFFSHLEPVATRFLGIPPSSVLLLPGTALPGQPASTPQLRQVQ